MTYEIRRNLALPLSYFLSYFNGMQANATQRSGSSNSPAHTAQYRKVLDGRKQPIRGLWQSTASGKFYAQLAFEDSGTGAKITRRVLLVDKDTKPVATVAQAREAMVRLRVKRSDDDLPVLVRTPKFPDFVNTYLAFITAGEGMKKPETIVNERSALRKWVEHLGEIRLDKIRESHMNSFVAKRLNDGLNPRTVNLDIVTLRNVLKHARKERWIKALPEVEWLKSKSARRSLFTVSDLENLCAAAMEVREEAFNDDETGEQKTRLVPVTKNGEQFCDFIRLLAYCGAREQEALGLRWRDVDFERGQLTIGATGDTKNRTGRVVDFNPKLKAHLEDMNSRRAPDTEWIFPSPQRGEKDIRAKTFRESLIRARTHAAKLDPELASRAFHDCRHHFISYAVMSGIDFMTIAAWVGHKDGGILIGKVYGHLADSHKREQAQRLNFGPAVVEAKEAL